MKPSRSWFFVLFVLMSASFMAGEDILTMPLLNLGDLGILEEELADDTSIDMISSSYQGALIGVC